MEPTQDSHGNPALVDNRLASENSLSQKSDGQCQNIRMNPGLGVTSEPDAGELQVQVLLWISAKTTELSHTKRTVLQQYIMHAALVHTDAHVHTKHRTECRVPNRGVRDRTQRAEGGCNPIGRTTISPNQPPPELPGTKPLTKEYTWLQLHM